MTKKFSLLLIICIVKALNICAEVYTGSCGDNVNYSLDTSTGILSITGTGAMTDYSNTGGAPWYEQRANIKSVEIADGVTSIGERTFRNCNAITSISISNSVKSINSYAFSNCSGLTSVTIPNGVTSIGLNAFDFNLTSIVVASGNAKFDSRDNCNAVIETATNTLIMTCQNTVIPNSVRCIGNYAFYRCPDFSSVTIPNSVTSIGDYAFYNCSSLTSVDMFSNIESIGTAAFKGTTWYDNQPDGMIYVGKVFYKYKGTMPENTSITIDEGTLGIAGSAFSSCSGLKSVSIPNSVTSIGNSAFDGCTNLTSVTCEATSVPSTVNSVFTNVPQSSATLYVLASALDDYKNTSPWSEFGTIKAIGDWEVISGSCGENVNYTLDTETGALSITGTGAMTDFSNTGGAPWYDAQRATVKSVEIAEGVTSIGKYAFYGCSGLESVTIPNSVTSIGDSAFGGCSGLISVHITDLAAWCKIDFPTLNSNPLFFAHHLFMNAKEIIDLVIPNSVTSIGAGAFSGCSGLTSVTIPNSVTSIKGSAFRECLGLKSVTIPNSVTSIAYMTFADCISLTSIIIPNSIKSIGSSAFERCSSLTEVYCNAKNVPTTGTYTFKNASISNATLYVPATSVAAYKNATPWNGFGSIAGNGIYYGSCGDNVNYSLDTSTGVLHITGTGAMTISITDNAPWYEQRANIKSVEIAEGVTSIGSDAFLGCSGLTSVTIGNSVTSIGQSAFRACSGLTSVTIPNSVTSIFNEAFHYCSGLTSIEIPNSVTYVGLQAFSGTAWYKNQPDGLIYAGKVAYNYKGTMPENTSITIDEGTLCIAGSAFSGRSGLTSVTIPNSVTSIGFQAFYNCSGLTSVNIPNSVISIGSSAFYGCSGLTSVTIGNSVTSIEQYAFKDCSGLAEVYCDARNVPKTSTYAFENASISNATLYVPATSVAAYQAAKPWNNFGIVKAILNGSCGENVNFTLDTETGVLSITGTGAMTNYSSSSNVPWYSIKSYIKSVEITDSVTSIGERAFYNCSGLTSITIPNSVTSIGSYAFYGCSGLTSVTIPNSVISIGSSAFYGCSGLTSVTIPNSVTSIGEYAFSGCSGLTSVTIPNSVTAIGKYSFYNCSCLTSVSIGDSVTTIGNSAFSGCSGLTKVTLYSNAIASKAYSSSSTIGNIFGSQVKEYVLGDNVKSIGNYAFYNCDSLMSVTIPNSVISLGGSAFYGCTGLESITIPKSVTTIGSSAFSGCSGLTEVYCNAENVPNMGTDAFNNINIANATLYLPAAFVAAYMAVEPWSKFGTVKAQGGSVIYNGSCGDNVRYSLDIGTGVLSITGTGAMTSSSSTSSVPWYSYRSYIKTVEIADGVTSIGDHAFYGCFGLTSVTIPNSVISIGECAFLGCSGLEFVTIPNRVTSIGGSAFYGCSSLISMTIPNNVTSIGNTAFEGCSGLTKVELNNNTITSKTYSSSSTIGNIFGSQVKEYIIGDSVTSIGSYAFYNCSTITSVTISNSVTEIGDYAFYNCSGFTSVDMFSNVESIGIGAFSGTTWYDNQPDGMIYVGKTFYKYKGTMPENTSITIDEGTLCIAGNAFDGCSGLVSVTIPNSVTEIGDQAFLECSGLTKVTLNNNAIVSKTYSSSSTIGNIFGSQVKEYVLGDNVKSIGSNAFYNCSGLTSVTIPSSVTSIGNSAFNNCSGLTSIEIPSSVTTIGSSAFYGCGGELMVNCKIPSASSSTNGAFYGSKFKSVKIGENVTSIGNYAFYGCSSLESVTIPNSVTSIGSSAFYGCGGELIVNCKIPSASSSTYGVFYGSKFKSVKIGESVKSIGNYAFYNCSDLTSVSIGDSVTTIGSSAFQGCSKLTSVDIKDVAAWCNIKFSDYNSNPLYYAKHLFMSGKEITDLVIPDSVASIGNYSFYNCSSLTSVSIGDSVTAIGSSAFQGCSKLTSVDIKDVAAWCNIKFSDYTSNPLYYAKHLFMSGKEITDLVIPDSVTSIRNYVIYNCSGLTSITIPNSVKSIGSSAFNGCSGLTEVYCNAENVPTTSTDAFNNANISNATLYVPAASVAAYMAVDPWSKFGTVKTQGGSEIYNGSCGTNVRYSLDTGTGVLSITGTGAMTNYSSSSNVPWYSYISYIKTVEITNGITSIGNYALYNCDSLALINIPNSVTSIGNSAFYGCSGLTSIEIPSSVTSIGSSAFSGCGGELIVNCRIPSASQSTSGAFYGSKFKSVKIRENVTSIGNYAFYKCDSLVSITIPSSVTSIGSNAFYGCSGLESVTIPNNVTSIGSSAFYGCSGLTSIEIPSSVTSIGSYAFSGCTGELIVNCKIPSASQSSYGVFYGSKFKSVTIGESVTSIGNYAFYGCSNLTSIIIPNSVTSIGSYAFSGCTGELIVNCKIPSASQSSYGVFYGSKFKSVKIGDYVTSIGDYAFYNCDSLALITIPNSVTSIGNFAFYGCSGLTSIEIPSSVTSIGSSAFSGCGGELIVNCKIPSASQSTNGVFYGSKFKSVKIGEDVTSIGDYAFYDCDSLVYITIPNSVTSIGSSAFTGCEVLTQVAINSNTIVSTGDYSLCSIFGSQVKEYIIGKDVTSILAGKFSDCTDLAYITIPTSVKSIGNSAFRNCPKLESVVIPNSVTSIGEYALSDCANLKSVTIGSGVQVIGKDVFENHHPSKVFWLTNTPPEGYAYAEGSINYVSNTRYTEFSNVIRYSSLSSIFEVDGIRYVPVNPSARTCDAIDCTYDESIDSINIDEKVTYRGIALSVKQVSPYTCYENKYIKDINLSFKGDIGAKAFYGCSNMTTAELGNGILSIGESGFSSCSKLESIVIPDSVVAINDSTFCDCIVLNSAKIGRGVESIGRYAFSGCSVLPNIRIPRSVTSVAEYAFMGCENIKTVVMEDGNSELSLSSNGSNPLFVDCPLDSVYIGRNILYETSAEYGYSPFYHNETLRTVVITDNETEISDNEFYSCTNLQSFKIGDGVTRFGNWAFSGCSSLKTLGFGTELQSIGQEAFSDCSAVTVIVSRTEIPPVCESQALEDINKWECTLYVPEGTSPDYQEADQWKDFWYMEEGAPYVVIRGDVNGDEFVNMKDAIFVTNIILGLEDATEAADVNNDGKINIQDVMFIVNYIKNGTFPDE